MKGIQFTILFAVTLSLGFSFSPQAFAGDCLDAQPGAASGDAPPQTDPQCISNNPGNTWLVPPERVTIEDARAPIGYEPGAGPWIKVLFLPSPIDQFQMDTVEEYLTVSGSIPWTDWHEVIQDPNFVFDPAYAHSAIATLPGGQVVIGDVSLDTIDGKSVLWVLFPEPLITDTELDIVKKINYIGPPGQQPFVVEMWQWPTIDELEAGIGGDILSIDSAALLLVGAQTNTVWIMSTLAVIGSVAFGALYITSKRK